MSRSARGRRFLLAQGEGVINPVRAELARSSSAPPRARRCERDRRVRITRPGREDLAAAASSTEGHPPRRRHRRRILSTLPDRAGRHPHAPHPAASARLRAPRPLPPPAALHHVHQLHQCRAVPQRFHPQSNEWPSTAVWVLYDQCGGWPGRCVPWLKRAGARRLRVARRLGRRPCHGGRGGGHCACLRGPGEVSVVRPPSWLLGLGECVVCDGAAPGPSGLRDVRAHRSRLTTARPRISPQ